MQAKHLLSQRIEPIWLHCLLLHGHHPAVFQLQLVPRPSKSSKFFQSTLPLIMCSLQVTTAFTSSRNEFKLVESLRKEAPIESGIRLDQNAREIVYSEFSNRRPDVYYWSLPSRYLGDKLTSYGGYLRYSVRHVPSPGGQSSRNTAPDVELISVSTEN